MDLVWRRAFLEAWVMSVWWRYDDEERHSEEEKGLYKSNEIPVTMMNNSIMGVISSTSLKIV